MRFLFVLAIGLGSIAVGCGGDDADGDHSGDHGDHGAESPSAQTTLMPKSGNATLAGAVKFSGETGKVQAMVTLMGAPAGMHGLHIHETGDCSAADAMSAGGHWNPSMHMHAAPGPNAHLGDLGNITVDASGNGTLTATNAAWEIGTGGAMDLVGKAVIVHAMPDDLMTQPTGNAGGRIGCGVIVK